MRSEDDSALCQAAVAVLLYATIGGMIASPIMPAFVLGQWWVATAFGAGTDPDVRIWYMLGSMLLGYLCSVGVAVGVTYLAPVVLRRVPAYLGARSP